MAQDRRSAAQTVLFLFISFASLRRASANSRRLSWSLYARQQGVRRRALHIRASAHSLFATYTPSGTHNDCSSSQLSEPHLRGILAHLRVAFSLQRVAVARLAVATVNPYNRPEKPSVRAPRTKSDFLGSRGAAWGWKMRPRLLHRFVLSACPPL